MVSEIEKFKAEYREVFAERKSLQTKNSVFSIMSDLDDITQQLEAITVQASMLSEKKENLEAQLLALGGN